MNSYQVVHERVISLLYPLRWGLVQHKQSQNGVHLLCCTEQLQHQVPPALGSYPKCGHQEAEIPRPSLALVCTIHGCLAGRQDVPCWVQLVNPRHLHPCRRDWEADGVAFSLIVTYSHHCSDGNMLGRAASPTCSTLLCSMSALCLNCRFTAAPGLSQKLAEDRTDNNCKGNNFSSLSNLFFLWLAILVSHP